MATTELIVTHVLSDAGRLRHGLIALLLLVLWLAAACSVNGDPPTGGETHFLSHCLADADCGASGHCLCGICSEPCGSVSDCPAYTGVTCILSQPSTSMQCSSAGPYCDAVCSVDADCVGLPGSNSCELGRCRASLPSALTQPEQCPQAGLAPAQLALLGDSFFATTHEVAADLSALAVSSGVLGAGASYQDQSSLLDNALALNGNGILTQYESASAVAAVRVVVMTGGGADVLLGQCDPPYASCPTISDAVAAAQDSFARMAAGGVTDVVYVFYPDPVDSTLADKIAALRPLARTACAQSAVPCHWLDLRTVFADHSADYLSADGMNPSSAGSQATAAAIEQLLVTACIAQ